MSGWIKLHRKIQDHPLYYSEPFTKMSAWIDILLIANHSPKTIFVRGNQVYINRGQFAYSEITLSKKWGWSRNKLRRFLNYLETIQQIKQQKNSILSLYTVINYENYQGINTENETTDDTTERQQKDINKNDKNDKNDYIYADSPSAHNQLSIGEEYLQQKLDNKSNVTHEFQVQALEIIEALNIQQNRKGAYFKAVRDFPRVKILEAYSFAVDHPNIQARDKMFFWKLNQKNEDK